MQNMEKTVVGATKWSMITEIVAKLISPVVNMILARILVPEAFGAVATITMIISFAEVFADAGFQKYIIQHEFKDDKDFDESVNVAFWSNLSMSCIFVFLIWIFRHNLAEWVGAPELSMGISVASFNIIFVAFSSIQMAIYRRNFKFKNLFFVRVIISLIPLVVTVPLAIIFRNFWALVIGTLCMKLIQAVVLTWRSKWKPRLYYSFKKLKEMFAFTSWTLLETILIWLASYIGTFIVGRFFDDYNLGIYKTSMTTVNAYMALITEGTAPVMFAALSRCQNDDETFKATYYNFQKAVAMLLIPLGVGIYIYRDLVVDILLGSQWHDARNLVGLWGLASAISIVLGQYGSEVYRGKGRTKLSMLTQAIHLLFVVPTIFISSKYGFEVLCISRVAVKIQYFITAMIVLQACFKIKIIETIKNILPQTISTCVMGIIAILIKNLLPGMLWQIVSAGVCTIVYLFTLLSFPSMRKIIMKVDIIKRLRTRLKNR